MAHSGFLLAAFQQFECCGKHHQVSQAPVLVEQVHVRSEMADLNSAEKFCPRSGVLNPFLFVLPASGRVECDSAIQLELGGFEDISQASLLPTRAFPDVVARRLPCSERICTVASGTTPPI